MTPLQRLARVIQPERLSAFPAGRFDRLKLHLVDTLGSLLAGTRTVEGRSIARLLGGEPGGFAVPGHRRRSSLGRAVLVSCAATRCTEADDIHLASCTTPGSVVVSTALSLAAAGRLRSCGAFFAALLAGYEALVRFGLAIDGPRVLLENVWPTFAAAPIGAAATAAHAYELDAAQTTAALACAMALSATTPVRGGAGSAARWIALGLAARAGVDAADCARRGGLTGVKGPAGSAFPLNGLVVSAAHLSRRLGARCSFDEMTLKPFPTARQGLAAVQAALDLARRHDIAPREITGIRIGLPEPQRRIVDRPGIPGHRLESTVSVRYQVALALSAPARLIDVRRKPVYLTRELRRLMDKTVVARDRRLEPSYPSAWPARVVILLGTRRLERTVVHPAGDARAPLGWAQVAAKFRAMASPPLPPRAAEGVVRTIQSLELTDRMPALWDLDQLAELR